MTTAPTAELPDTYEPRGVRAEVIAHSRYTDGTRFVPDLITVQGRCHRFVLAELNTHGAIVRSSASTRAIPLATQIQRIRSELAIPVVWATEKRGMQGGGPIEFPATADLIWHDAARHAIKHAQLLAKEGVHKSLAGRILEPFMWHTVAMTATAWQNFFRQRVSPLAQPEIHVLAHKVQEAIAASTPRLLADGEWHLPYVDGDTAYDAHGDPAVLARVAAARTARTSYLTMDGSRSIAADLDLYEGTEDKVGLVSADPPHWTPLEHVATPWPENRQTGELSFHPLGPTESGDPVRYDLSHLPKQGRLLGWRTLRLEVEATRGLTTFE